MPSENIDAYHFIFRVINWRTDSNASYNFWSKPAVISLPQLRVNTPVFRFLKPLQILDPGNILLSVTAIHAGLFLPSFFAPGTYEWRSNSVYSIGA